MNLFDDLKASVIAALGHLSDTGLLPRELDLTAVTVTPAADPAHGEVVTNAAMVVARQVQRSPRDVAAALARTLSAEPRIAASDVAGPGFVNLRLVPGAWQAVLAELLSQGDAFGRGQRRERLHIVCDPGARLAPPTLGQGRCCIFADALASLMAFAGHEVSRTWSDSDGGFDLSAIGIQAGAPDVPSSEAIADAVAALPDPAQNNPALTDAAGGWTHLASGLSRLRSAVRIADRVIWVCEADAGVDAKTLEAAAAQFSHGRVGLQVHRTQPVRLVQGGRIERVSLATARAALGPDILRFALLARRNDAPHDLDVAAALAQSCSNPAFRVQFAHVHVQAALDRARSAGIDVSDTALRRADLGRLDHPAEQALMRRIAAWPLAVAEAARAAAPHRIAAALDRLAGDFHDLRAAAGHTPALQLVQEANPETTRAKIAMTRAVGIVIAAGLGILGVTPAQQMH